METVIQQLLALRNRQVLAIHQIDEMIECVGRDSKKGNVNEHIESIVELCSNFFHVQGKLIKTSGKHPFPDIRKMIAKICKDQGHTAKSIGSTLGGRDHSTILTAIKKHQDLVDTEENYKREYFTLINYIKFNTENTES